MRNWPWWPHRLAFAFGLIAVAVLLGLPGSPLRTWRSLPAAAALRQQAVERFAAGRLDEAMVDLQRALALNPNDPLAHYDLGLVWEATGRDDRAAGEYRRALGLKADLSAPRYNLAAIHWRKGEYEAAERELLIALDRQAVFPGAHYLLGQVYRLQHHPDAAAAQFETALSEGMADRPNVILAHLYAGDAEEDQGHGVAATRHWQAVLELDPGNAGARSRLEAGRRSTP